MKKRLFFLPLLALASGVLAGCGESPSPAPEPEPAPVEHTHTYSSAWSTNASSHWHAATCGHDVKGSFGAHIDADSNEACDVCGYAMPKPVPHEHTYSDEWSYDEETHWHAATCEHQDLIKDEGYHVDENRDGICEICEQQFTDPFDPNVKLAPAEFLDENGKTHKRVSEVVDGGHYYLGYYRAYSEGMRFANGEPHKDGDKTFPFYIGTDEEGKIANAAEIIIDYNDGGTSFTMQIDKDGATWDDRYLSVYMASSSYGNIVYSIYAAEKVGDKHAGTEEGATSSGEDCYYDFQMMPTYNDYNLGVPYVAIQDTRLEEEEPQPKFLGSGVDGDGVGYISIDCSNAEKAMGDTYNLAFFYEI